MSRNAQVHIDEMLPRQLPASNSLLRRKCAAGDPGKTNEGDVWRQDKLQRTDAGSSGMTEVPSFWQDRSGSPDPPSTNARSLFGLRLGHNFSRIHVHSETHGDQVMAQGSKEDEEEKQPVTRVGLGEAHSLVGEEVRTAAGSSSAGAAGFRHPQAVSLKDLRDIVHGEIHGSAISGPPVATDLATVQSQGSGNPSRLGWTAYPKAYTAPNIDFNTTKSKAGWYSRPKLKTPAYEGAASSYYPKAGKYKTKIKERGRAVYWDISGAISSRINAGEQEHCDDHAEAFRISLEEAEIIIKKNLIGKAFGPKPSKATAEALVLARIKKKLIHPALGNDIAKWTAKYQELFKKSHTRDASGWHTLGDEKSVDSNGHIIYEFKKGASQIGTKSSSAIVTY